MGVGVATSDSYSVELCTTFSNLTSAIGAIIGSSMMTH